MGRNTSLADAFGRLIDEVGFGWSVRILGFTVFATLLVPIFVMKMRVKPTKARALFDSSAFTDWPYASCVLICTIGYIGLFTGIFYFSFFAEATGITNHSLAFYLVPILNAGSVLGRTLPNMLADKIGPLNVIIPGAGIMGIVLFCNLAVQSSGSLIAIIFFFGIFSGEHPPFLHTLRHNQSTDGNPRHLHRSPARPLRTAHGRQVQGRHAHRHGLRDHGLWRLHWRAGRRRHLRQRTNAVELHRRKLSSPPRASTCRLTDIWEKISALDPRRSLRARGRSCLHRLEDVAHTGEAHGEGIEFAPSTRMT